MTTASFELRLTRFIRAAREKVYDAFVNAELLSAWHCPRGMTVQATADARVGGAYRLQMSARDGTGHAVGGHYVELRRPERLAYTWAWEGGGPLPEGMHTLIEVDLLARDGGTELRMRHSGFPAQAMVPPHQRGWDATLKHLADQLDPQGTAGTLTLLGDPRSTYVRTARMAFAEKGVAVRLQTVAPHSPELLAVNPFGRVPALQDGDTPIWETSAIVRFVDESFGNGLLFTPGTVAARVANEQWISSINSYLYDCMVRRYVLQILFPRGDGGQPDRTVIDQALTEMAGQLATLEAVYAKGDYLSGNTLAAADLFLAPILFYVEQMPEGQRLLSDRPAIRRAQALMRQRASFNATAPDTAPDTA